MPLLAAALVLALGLAACTPTPAPAPSATGFATEEEAFAAAEETYRAYVDALNAVDLGDPETFEAVYAWTTGEANAGERKSLSQMSADEWSVSGAVVVASLSHISFSHDRVEVSACADVSGVDVRDASGASQVSDERPSTQSVLIALVPDGSSPSGLLIAELKGSGLTC